MLNKNRTGAFSGNAIMRTSDTKRRVFATPKFELPDTKRYIQGWILASV